MGNSISYSSELMQNFVQGQVMDPQDNFEALLTSTGLSLLFYQSSAGVFNVAQEAVASSTTGWTTQDLSTSLIQSQFPGLSGVVVKTFEAVSEPGGSITLAMVVNNPNVNPTAGQDTLFLSLGNSSTDLSWVSSPVWTSFPYDSSSEDAGVSNATLNIEGVFLGDGGDIVWVGEDSSHQNVYGPCIVVDALSSGGSISRFFIDPTKFNGYAWCFHPLAAELTPGQYQTCLGHGRNAAEGLYTSGTVDSDAQFVFTPLYNFNPKIAPESAVLSVPSPEQGANLTANALAACRNAD